MKIKDCGLITAQNGVITVTGLSELQIDWKQVSESFYESFRSVYLNAYAILMSDNNVNLGLNYMTVLERIGNRINGQQITQEDTFGAIWENETESILVDLEIA